MIYVLVLFSMFPVFHSDEGVYRGQMHEPTVLESFAVRKDCDELQLRLQKVAQLHRYYACIPLSTK